MARDISIKVFSWILYMREPLTPSALLSALAIVDNSTTLQLSRVLSICENLVVLDTKCNVLRVADQSAKEFLERHEIFPAATAHDILTSTCLNACTRGLGSEAIVRIPCDDLSFYAALYWPVHFEMAQGLDTNGDPSEMVSSFIFDEHADTTQCYKAWSRSIRRLVLKLPHNHAMKPVLDAIPDSNYGPMFMASVFGLDSILDMIFSKLPDVDINIRNHLGQTAVYLAAALGHATTVTMLVDKGAELNVDGGRYGSPLYAACFQGHVNVVDTLLRYGASTTHGTVFDNALQAAYLGGKKDVALLLVEHYPVITTLRDYDRAIEGAARAGFTEVLDRLQESNFVTGTKGAPHTMRQKIKKTIEGGHVDDLRRYMDKQTGDITKYLPCDAVALAALFNHKSMVEFLLDEGMEVESPGIFGTPLRTACLLNCESVVRLVLDRGADINAHCDHMGDALQIAAANNHTSIVKLLIDEGADLDQKSGFYGRALQAAAFLGQKRAVEILLDAGADVQAVGISMDGFHAAAEGGHEDVMMSILQKGFQFRVKDYLGGCFGVRSPSRYKALQRDASPGRDDHPRYGFWNSERSSLVAFPQMPIFDLETILKAAKVGVPPVQTAAERNMAFSLRHKPGRKIDPYHPVEVGASAGHEGVVKFLLERTEVLGIRGDDIDEAMRYASGNEHVAGEKYRDSKVPKYMMFFDFVRGCEGGDVKLITAILDSGQHKRLSSKEMAIFVLLGARNGHVNVVQAILESPSLKHRNIDTIEAFVVAAAHGRLKVVETLAGYWPDCQTSKTKVTLQRALVVSSENGHVEVVRYLVQGLNADVNILAPDVPISPGLVARKEIRVWLTSGTLSWLDYIAALLMFALNVKPDDDDWLDPPKVTLGHPKGTTLSKTRRISAMQAAMRGFASKYDPSRDYRGYFLDPESVKADRIKHEEAIIALLDHGADPNELGGQERFPIQLAAKYCPGHVVQRCILAGADVNATKQGDSALQEAAGRELSAVSVMQCLFDAGATISDDIGQSDKLLANALDHFEGDVSRTVFLDDEEDPDGRFLVAPSLEYVFTEGSAAVLHSLLSSIPHKEATDTRYGLVLQMAASLNKEQHVDLLLSRGTDVNATGYYYGTALQAAARFGHEKMVQKLIWAGAEVNILQGRWHTALRAALVDGHEGVVQMLLAHGADIQLRFSDQKRRSGERKATSCESNLQIAVKSGNSSVVKTLLAGGADANQDVPDTVHPLIQSAKKGNVEIVQALLDAGVRVNVPEKKRRPPFDEASPLHAAIAKGHADVVKELLSRGANLGYCSEIERFSYLNTALNIAAGMGQHQIVQLLVSAGANSNESEALSEAVKGGYTGIVETLLAAGEEATNVRNLFPIACRQGKSDLVEALLEEVYSGSDPECLVNDAIATATRRLQSSVVRLLLDYAPITTVRFKQACAAGLVDHVQSVLDHGAVDINDEDERSGDFPLQVAASWLQPGIVHALLLRGADVRYGNHKHGTALMAALEASVAPLPSMRRWQLLQERKVEEYCLMSTVPSPIYLHYPYFRQKRPSSFLHLSRSEEVVRDLVSYGANINDDSRVIGPPLHFACLLGSKTMVKMFLDKGADINKTAGYFEKAIFAALHGRHPDIVLLLLERAPLTDHFHPEYATPLHFACDIGDGVSTRKLLEHGADATVMNSKGETPLSLALRHGYGSPPKETPLAAIIKLAHAVHMLDDDLEAAAKLGGYDYDDTQPLATLLKLDKDIVLPEQFICRVLRNGTKDKETIHLIMQKSGGIGVTAEILKAAQSFTAKKILLDYSLRQATSMFRSR